MVKHIILLEKQRVGHKIIIDGIVSHLDRRVFHDGIQVHTSRHTFGTMMMTVGADLYTTCKLMGHADVRTTQIYAKIVDSKKIEAVDMVDKMFEQEEAKD